MNSSFKRQRVGRLPPIVIHKWSREVLLEGFVPFPKRLLRCMTELFTGPNGVRELAVVLAVVDYRRPGLLRDPSVGFLAFLAGMTIDEFSTTLDALEQRGLVTRESVGDRVNLELGGLLEEIVRAAPEDTDESELRDDSGGEEEPAPD